MVSAGMPTCSLLGTPTHRGPYSAASGSCGPPALVARGRPAGLAKRTHLALTTSSRGHRGRAQAELAEQTEPAPGEQAQSAGPVEISLRFIGPGEKEQAQFSLPSGTKNLRRAMLDAKVPIYDMYGSLMNCGGGGSCGTCAVDIQEGAQLLSPRTDPEDRFLKKKPETWRLSCQTIVGDKTNSGSLVVRTMPQKK